ncbi:uncharacterized protein [Aegilops tauschii subsp. strangulata]|uniref:uncharacterized protein n=1 Tax=Aegilops tauschii subsp. strangulata TaxID=200361 RepID=UPI003CC8E104
MSAASGYVAVPRCPVIFDGTNYTEFAGFMRIHMRGIRLWGVLSGEVCCPPRPVPPVAPTPPTPLVLPPDATQAAKDAAKIADEAADRAYDERALAYEEALQTYHGALSVYTQWLDDDARAAAVLTASVLPQFASEFLGLPTVFQMWTCLRQRYEPSGDALYLSVVRQEHALQQGDSTVDAFYAQSSAIWRQLDSLRSAGCRTCPCCQAVQADLEFHRVYEFLSRLRKEFEPRRAQLLARGRISLMEALSEIRAEETRLRGAGLLEVPSVLATRVSSTPPAAPPHSRSSAPPLLPTPSGGSGRPRSHCDYCKNDGHIESQCYTKRKHLRKARSSGTASSPSPVSAIALTEQDILRLKRLLAASGSSSTGTAGSVTDASRTEHPPSTQSGSSHAHSGWGWPSPP